ncbi:MAG TPA: S8 family serine peptidase, partial [Steroidobacteraceae bacterium]|nr:S8 family serine peptidase [Steroidobacteraceae bacterium]
MTRRRSQGFLRSQLLATALAVGGTLACAGQPTICPGPPGHTRQRAPAAITQYLVALHSEPYDQRQACATWAGTQADRPRARDAAVDPLPARFIVFAVPEVGLGRLAASLGRNQHVHSVETASRFLVVSFARRTPSEKLRRILADKSIEYVEPDCDGPDFLTTSLDLMSADPARVRCWEHAARDVFPNDPCIDELWGHSKIGWSSTLAARSLRRVVAVLDSGIDSGHADLANNVMIDVSSFEPPGSQGRSLNERCATSGRCYPHGTEMAGTIGGRMDNGIGVAGIAPNSLLLPIVISRVDHGLLARLSTIAEGIDAAVRGGADVINISAKWPVDSRAISESVRAAVTAGGGRRRLLVTGYATSL